MSETLTEAYKLHNLLINYMPPISNDQDLKDLNTIVDKLTKKLKPDTREEFFTNLLKGEYPQPKLSKSEIGKQKKYYIGKYL